MVSGGESYVEDELYREQCLKTMRETLAPEGIDAETCTQMEASCWNGSVERCSDRGDRATTESVYVQACMSVIANLSRDPSVSNGNAYLLPAILAGSVDASRIAWMSATELDPTSYGVSKTKCFTNTTLGESDQFKCPRCGECRSVHYELQTRSADEATTVFITCVACSHKWTE